MTQERLESRDIVATYPGKLASALRPAMVQRSQEVIKASASVRLIAGILKDYGSSSVRRGEALCARASRLRLCSSRPMSDHSRLIVSRIKAMIQNTSLCCVLKPFVDGYQRDGGMVRSATVAFHAVRVPKIEGCCAAFRF